MPACQADLLAIFRLAPHSGWEKPLSVDEWWGGPDGRLSAAFDILFLDFFTMLEKKEQLFWIKFKTFQNF